jgi:hypothetical protein
MEPKLEKIWLGEVKGQKTIRLDWDNDRHHEVMISGQADVGRTVEALLSLARLIGKDPHLRA